MLCKFKEATEIFGDVSVQPTRGWKGKFGKDEERLDGEESVVSRTGTLEFVFEKFFRRMRGSISLEERGGIGVTLWWGDEGKMGGSLLAIVRLFR